LWLHTVICGAGHVQMVCNMLLFRFCQCSYVQVLLIGASLSEPHIDEFAVEFVSLYIYIVRRAGSHLRLLFCMILHPSFLQNRSQITQQEDTNCLPPRWQ